MARILIAETRAQQLRNAKTAYNPKDAKKSVWAAIRSTLGDASPRGAKLGVEVDPAMPDYRAVYVAKSSPRVYLTTPDTVAQTAPTNGGAFITIANPPAATPWVKLSRAIVLDMVRDCSDDGDAVGVLPVGFPQADGDDALVLDSSTGDLYFRK